MDHEGWMVGGAKDLKAHRDGKGRWRGYNFYYTLLALDDFDMPVLLDEMRYAAPQIEHTLRRNESNIYSLRRRVLAERILAKV